MNQNDFDTKLAEAIAGFYADPLGFVEFIYPWGEQGTPLAPWGGPDTWQVDFLTQWGEEIAKRGFNGVDAVPPIMMSIASGHGVGKSCLTAWIVHFVMSTRPMARGVVTSGKYAQLSEKTWSELAKWHKLALNGHWFDYRNSRGNLSYFKPGAKENWTVNGQAATKEGADSFAGLHNARSTPFFIFDEASAVPDEIYEVSLGGLTDGEPFIFLFGNPTRSTGFFADTFGKNRHRWINKQIDSRTARMTNKKLIKEWVDDYGEDSDFVRVRVKGQFPRVGDCQFISAEVVEKAFEREIDPTDVDPVVIGVDVARFGDDQSVITVRKGRKLVQVKKYRELDLMSMANMVVEAIRDFKPHTVFVDEAGLGGGVVDRLRQLGYPCIGVQAGSRPQSPEKFTNLRAEMWWRMREWLGVADLPEDNELLYDLTGIEYGYDERMRVKLEKKSDMKRRGLPSPDCFVAGTTVLTPSGGRPIEQLSVGDEVVTPVGVSRVVAVHKNTVDTVVRRQFSNGAELIGKGKHKIFTWDSGWTALNDLTTYNVMESAAPWRLLLWRTLTKSCIRTNPSTFKHHVDTISRGEKLSLNDFFTAEYGPTPMDRFRMGIASIILTATGRIMTWVTWNVSPVRCTPVSACVNDSRTRSTENEIRRPSMRPAPVLMSGPGPRRAESGADSTVNDAGKGSGLQKLLASAAEWCLRLRSRPGLNTVPTAAGNGLEAAKGDIEPPKAYASCAGAGSFTTGTNQGSAAPGPALIDLEACGYAVYNLTLDTENVYYANGILVQNCADAIAVGFAEQVNPVPRPRSAKRKRDINWRTL